jgi:hypothetical protein
MTPLAGYRAIFTTLSRIWKGRSAQFRMVKRDEIATALRAQLL